MSRIGEQSIQIPEKVSVKAQPGLVIVEGPLGKLEQFLPPEIKIEIKENKILVKRKKESRSARAMHGTIRSLLANMVEGVTQGFSKTLEIHGTGYRVKMEADKLIITVGFSHPVIVKAPQGIKFEIKGEKEIKISGLDKQKVGNTTAQIRKIKKPEPYKGKGIRYQGEVVKLKPGKAAKVGAGETKYE